MSDNADESDRFSSGAWRAGLGAGVGYGLILLAMFVALFVAPYLAFSAL
jgi:hypothetical protein